MNMYVAIYIICIIVGIIGLAVLFVMRERCFKIAGTMLVIAAVIGCLFNTLAMNDRPVIENEHIQHQDISSNVDRYLLQEFPEIAAIDLAPQDDGKLSYDWTYENGFHPIKVTLYDGVSHVWSYALVDEDANHTNRDVSLSDADAILVKDDSGNETKIVINEQKR